MRPEDGAQHPPSPRGAELSKESYVNWTVELVSCFILKNTVAIDGLQKLISDVYCTLVRLEFPETHMPAVPIEDSVNDEYLVCLEDGKRLKSLRRHLLRTYRMSPEDYRRKWRLPDDYPMVAPAYSRARSEIARRPGQSDDFEE